MLGFVYFFILLGLISMLLYILKFLRNPTLFIAQDFSHPAKIATVSAFSMSVSLMGKAIAIYQLNLPPVLPVVIVYIGAAIQLIAMIFFFISCYKKCVWVEPYWNNAVHSSVFIAVCLLGDNEAAVVCRGVGLSIGLLFLLPDFSIMVVRALWVRGEEREVVANNPTVAMLQAGCSITCTGWLIAPLTEDAVSGVGECVCMYVCVGVYAVYAVFFMIYVCGFTYVLLNDEHVFVHMYKMRSNK